MALRLVPDQDIGSLKAGSRIKIQIDAVIGAVSRGEGMTVLFLGDMIPVAYYDNLDSVNMRRFNEPHPHEDPNSLTRVKIYLDEEE